MARSLFGMGWSLASTVAKLERCQRTPMSIPWGDHLDLAKCVALIGEDDLREATTAMGRCLFHLQRDLQRDLLLDGIGAPEVRTRLDGRPALIVVRGYHYKEDLATLKPYLNERARIKGRRTTGACAKHQSRISDAVKNAREMALIPYTPS